MSEEAHNQTKEKNCKQQNEDFNNKAVVKILNYLVTTPGAIILKWKKFDTTKNLLWNNAPIDL